MVSTPTAIHRTLLLALGDQGLAVVRAFRARLTGRRPPDGVEAPSVALLALTSGPHGVGPIPTVQLSASDADPPEIQAVLNDHIDEVAAGILAALAGISRVSQGIGTGTGLRSAEVDVYLVAGLDEPLAGILVDIAYLVRQLVDRRLNSRARIWGLLLLPDPVALEDPEPALVRACAILKRVDAYMGSHDGYRRPYADGRVVEGWGPVFDGECFLVGALNRDGLRLANPQARVHLIAEALFQLIVNALGRRVLGAEPMLHTLGGRPGYAGLGLASLVYPAKAIHEHLAWRLARQMLATWTGEHRSGRSPTEPAGHGPETGPSDGGQFAAVGGQPLRPEAQPEGSAVGPAVGGRWSAVTPAVGGPQSAVVLATAFLADHGFSPGSVRHRLLPRQLLAEAKAGHAIHVYRPWGELDTLREAIDDAVANRLEVLNERRDELERVAKALAEELAHVLDDHLTDRLDHPAPASLQRDLAFVRMLRSELLALARREAEGADELWGRFQAISAEAEESGKYLSEVGSRMVACRPTSLRALLGLLLRPHRWPGIWRLRRALHRAKMAYLAHLERQVELTVAILEADLVARFLEEAASRVESREHRLASLLDALRATVAHLSRDEGPVCDAPPGFDLEWSVLTPHQVEALYAETVGDLMEELTAFAASQGRLSAWMEETTDAATIRAAVLSFAHRRLHRVFDVTAGQMLAARYPEAARQREALEALLDAAVPFIAWDETALRAPDGEAVRETTVLGVPAADFEFVAELVESSARSMPVVSTADPYRIVALCLVHGIPLAAIPVVKREA